MDTTLIEAPITTPSAYYEGLAEETGTTRTVRGGYQVKVLRTRRTGEQGRLQAQYIVDRLASGLYFGRVVTE